MNNIKPKILIAFKTNGENGGPYISHDRIIRNEFLKTKYDFEKIWIPRARQFLNPFKFFKFVKSIKNSKPDLVHVAGLQLDGFLLMLACQFAKVKTVVAIHGSTSEAIEISHFKKRIICKLEKYTIRKASIVYGVSDYVSSWDICKYTNRYFGTIYNFTKEPGITHTNSDIRKELCISEDDIVIVSTGRITKEKGFDMLCSITRHFKKRDNVKFIVVGNGPYLDEFQELVRADDMSNQVYLIGYRSDISNILKASDIFIICTKHETLCISALEAAMESLPLIVSNVGGLSEIVDKSCGYLLDPNNEDGFVSALTELINSKEKRIFMGKLAYLKVNEKFKPEAIERKISDMYEIVLNN